MTTGKAGGSKVGKFGIGVHVVDDVGDVGVIVGKRKGERQVDYDRYGKIWVPKFRLAVATNDNATTATPSISPEIVVNDYSGAADGENSSEWVPKVGDRVRFKDRFVSGDGVIVAEAQESSFDWTVKPDTDAGGYFYKDGRFDYRTRLFASASLEPLPVAEQPAAAPEATTTGLTIEAGKSYRTRDGRKAGPLEDYESQDTLSGYVEGDSSVRVWYIEGGKHRFNEANIDLVAEWVEPAAEAVEAPATEQPKFKAGDKVRALKGTFSGDYKAGEIYEVSHALVGHVQTVRDSFGSKTNGWGDSNFELVEETQPAKFKVGDRVVIIGNEGDPAVVKTRNSEGKMSIQFDWAERSGIEWWCDDELTPLPSTTASSPVTFARNDLVTLAAPVKVTGTSGDRVHISFPNGGSFTLPASALIAA